MYSVSRCLSWVGLAAALAIMGGVLSAQAPASRAVEPAFEVVSVKPSRTGDPGGSINVRPGGRFVVVNRTVRNMIRTAYQVQDQRIVGGPAWVGTERFDVLAHAPSDDVTMASMVAMIRHLLADRFGLVVHAGTREMPVYALVTARPDGRLGPGLRRSTTECLDPVAAGRLPPAAAAGRPPSCGTDNTPGRMSARGVTLAELTRSLSGLVGRVTVDETGIADRIDLDLQWTTESPALPPTPASSAARETVTSELDGPSIFTALREQLGLRLEPRRSQVDVLIIDSAERPMPD